MSTLEKAIAFWEEGEPLPLDLFAALMAEGYDVEALEEEFCE